MEEVFDNYNINPTVKGICQALGYIIPSAIQKEVLQEITNSSKDEQRNYLIKSIAGTGKTFSYLLFCLNEFDFGSDSLQVVLLLPTRELAIQTANYFQQINLQSEVKVKYKLIVGGSKDINERKSEEGKGLLDGVQVAIGTLGKLYSTFKNTNKATFSALKCLVVDEADKMTHQNKDRILEKCISLLTKVRGEVKAQPKVILVSASIDDSTINFYKDYIPNYKLVSSHSEKFHPSEIKDSPDTIVNSHIREYYHTFKPERKTTYFEQKYSRLFGILNTLGKDFKQCLIFYNQKGRGEELAADLREGGWSTSFIHADLSQDQRILIYNKIKNVEVKVILATDLFSRGIDLSTVDLVLNFDSPYDDRDYFHRVGRTGRYNSHGIALSFFQENEVNILERIKQKDPSNKLQELREFGEDTYTLLKSDFTQLKSSNKVSQEVLHKIKLIDESAESFNTLNNSNTLNYSNTLNNSNTLNSGDTFVNKKRRRDQYNQESIPSDWVNVEDNLYDSSNFNYLEEESETKCEFCLYCNLFKIFENGII